MKVACCVFGLKFWMLPPFRDQISTFFFTKNTTSLTEKWNSYILDRGETHFKTSNKLFQKLLCFFFFSPLYLIWILICYLHPSFYLLVLHDKRKYTVEQISWMRIKSVCTWRENIKTFMFSASITKVLKLKYPSLVIPVFIFLLFSPF